MSDRQSFLHRVRQASVAGRQYRVHLTKVPEDIGYLGAGSDVCERMATEVNAVGGEAIVVETIDSAAQQLAAWLKESAARTSLIWRHALLDRIGIKSLLAAANIEAFEYENLATLPADQRRSVLLACDVGITSCDYAIAETGTLMMWSRPGQERLASLLPPVHIAIVERAQILPDLIDAVALLNQNGAAGLPSNVTFITGPSKTGDIELQLTTGVHGPGLWRVLIIR